MAATAEQVTQFNGLITAGNYAQAADLARGAGYSDADIAAYVGSQYGGNSANKTTDYLSGYASPKPVANQQASSTRPAQPVAPPKAPSGLIAAGNGLSTTAANNPSSVGSGSNNSQVVGASQIATTSPVATNAAPNAVTTPDYSVTINGKTIGNGNPDNVRGIHAAAMQDFINGTNTSGFNDGLVKSPALALDSAKYLGISEADFRNNYLTTNRIPVGGVNNQSGLITAPPSLTNPPQTVASTSDYSNATMNSWDRLAQMLGSGSPTMQAAQTAGMQYAQSRGLTNSTIGESAVVDAMTKAAQPYALQDATSNIGNSQFNAGQTNTVGLANTAIQADFVKTVEALGLEYSKLDQNQQQFIQQLTQQGIQFDKQLYQQAYQFASQIDLDYEKIGVTREQFTTELAEKARQFDASSVLERYKIDTSTEVDGERLDLMRLELEIKEQDSVDSYISNLYQQTITNITNLQGGGLAQADKDIAVNNQLQYLSTAIDMWAPELRPTYEPLLNTSNPEATTKTDNTTAETPPASDGIIGA